MSSGRKRKVVVKCDVALAKLKLLHITKTAGTALESLGQQLGVKWGRRWTQLHAQRGKLHPPHAGRLRSEWWHVPPRLFLENPYRNYVTFAVVRCPYARAISEFRCRWKGFCAPARGDAQKERRAHAKALELNQWLRQKLSKAARPPYQNCHFIPQHLYIFDTEGNRCVQEENVLRFEHLAEDLKAFGKRHGCDFPQIPRTNESEMPKFTVDDLEDETRALIESEFSDDFSLLGFQKLGTKDDP